MSYEANSESKAAAYAFNDPATGRRLFNVQIFAEGSPHIARHLAFRDYLRAHPAEAREYEAEKKRAAALADEVLVYNDLKYAWIKACEARALVWRGDRARD
jgi:GrpB-like predicted nucleotidyltransferase (UPF0157 family)